MCNNGTPTQPTLPKVNKMVSHGMPDDGPTQLPAIERQRNALRRLDDGHAALLDALAGLGEAEAFLGSRWSVWEVMQHLLTENFVEALEQIASGEREMLPPFDARTDRIAQDVARLEANYRRFRTLIAGLSESQLNLPATPYNPENNYPALSLLDLIERTSGHEGNHARQVEETRKFVTAFRSAERAITVAGLGTGDRESVPTRTRELLSNADYVIGTPPALDVARPWIRSVELPLRADNREELVNRLARDIRAGLWSMVVTLGDPSESSPGLLEQLSQAVGPASVTPASGFYRLALESVGISPLQAVCTSVEQIHSLVNAPTMAGRAAVVLGADHAGPWSNAASSLLHSGAASSEPAKLVTDMSSQAGVLETSLVDLAQGDLGKTEASIDSALVLN